MDSHLELLAAMWFGCGSRMIPPRDQLDMVDIEREYSLIQRKASRLSASQRREVMKRYEQMKHFGQ